MSAISDRTRSDRSASNRLPLTPKAMSNRRGGHIVTRGEPAPAPAVPIASTPAMHITPNVVTVARGDVGYKVSNALSDASQARALNMRNLRL